MPDPNPLAHLWNWFEVHSGTASPRGSPAYYNFWSGFGSDIAEVAILGGIIQLYRQHNCHTKGCWRIAKHEVEGTPYKVCRLHHPSVPAGGATREQIHRAHRTHRRAQAQK